MVEIQNPGKVGPQNVEKYGCLSSLLRLTALLKPEPGICCAGLSDLLGSVAGLVSMQLSAFPEFSIMHGEKAEGVVVGGL